VVLPPSSFNKSRSLVKESLHGLQADDNKKRPLPRGRLFRNFKTPRGIIHLKFLQMRVVFFNSRALENIALLKLSVNPIADRY
jgi:hypothetical protein